jgi:hypothetical protein
VYRTIITYEEQILFSVSLCDIGERRTWGAELSFGYGITYLVLPPSSVKLQRLPNDVVKEPSAVPDLIRGIQVKPCSKPYLSKFLILEN